MKLCASFKLPDNPIGQVLSKFSCWGHQASEFVILAPCKTYTFDPDRCPVQVSLRTGDGNGQVSTCTLCYIERGVNIDIN